MKTEELYKKIKSTVKAYYKASEGRPMNARLNVCEDMVKMLLLQVGRADFPSFLVRAIVVNTIQEIIEENLNKGAKDE